MLLTGFRLPVYPRKSSSLLAPHLVLNISHTIRAFSFHSRRSTYSFVFFVRCDFFVFNYFNLPLRP